MNMAPKAATASLSPSPSPGSGSTATTSGTKATTATVRRPLRLPFTYRFFFLVIEPISALVGAYFAHLRQHDYLAMTHAASAPALSAVPMGANASVASDAPASPTGLPTGTAVVLSQLANLYLLFAINEALVLRVTADLRVWRTLLLGLLVADLGHLYALRPLGAAVYYRIDQWNAMDMGNVPFVYVGASLRLAFLSGVGLGGGPQTSGKQKKT